jgi:UDP-N-acetylmuramoyl-tripeptide--D-alanyl-D-alanine ligase
MNHPGEISPLTRLAAPDVAVVTLIAPAHLEALGTIEGVAKEKLTIADGLNSDGVLVVNADDIVMQKEISNNPKLQKFKHFSFGSSPGADLSVSKIKAKGLEGISFEIQVAGVSHQVEMQILGTHNVTNVAAAVSGAMQLLPISVETVVEGLRSFRAPLMRLNLKALTENRWLIDDSYNANPASMSAALKYADDLKSAGYRLGLVLGDMRELGEGALKHHRQIAEQAAKLAPSFIVAVGQYADLLVGVAAKQGIPAFKAENGVQAAHIASKLPFDILLVKASRGIQLDQTVKTLEERYGVQFGSEIK